MNEYLPEIFTYAGPTLFLALAGFVIKLLWTKYKNGKITFEITAKSFADIEAENRLLKEQICRLQVKADIATESWAKMAKEQLCEECEKEEK